MKLNLILIILTVYTINYETITAHSARYLYWLLFMSWKKFAKYCHLFGDMGDAVGIYVLSDRGTIFNKERSREPRTYNEFLDHSSIFKLLRKKRIRKYHKKAILALSTSRAGFSL